MEVIRFKKLGTLIYKLNTRFAIEAGSSRGCVYVLGVEQIYIEHKHTFANFYHTHPSHLSNYIPWVASNTL